jgi:protein-histidine pros-kinase
MKADPLQPGNSAPIPPEILQFARSEAILFTLLESAPDAIIVVDHASRILIANSQAEKMFGYTRAELIAQPVELLVPSRFRDRHVQQHTQFLSNPHLRPMGIGLELRAQRKDGSEFPVEISLSPVSSEHGLLVTSIIRDITGRKEAEKALQEAYSQLEQRVQARTAELEAAYQELQARNEELDAFSHTVAHDLKSQLALITGYAEVLRENLATIPQENRSRYLESIARNGYKMARVIEQLLLVANVRQSQLETWPLQMELILAEALLRLSHDISASQAEIQLPDRWVRAIGNGPLIEEVWVNYIGNALKYGGSPPHIEISAALQPDGFARFSVKDNGPGITPEDQAALFKPFTRVGTSRASGSGLGLSIVKRIVLKLGGKVGVESRIGQGSTFYFTLPVP